MSNLIMKRGFVSVLGGIAAGLGTYLLFNGIIIIALGTILGLTLGLGIAFLVIKDKEAVVKAVETIQKAVTPDPNADVKQSLQSLLELNIHIRDQILNNSLIERIEVTIDKYREVVEIVNDKYPGDDITWEINRVCRNLLPKLVKTYIETGKTQEQQESFLGILANLEKQSEETQKLINNDNDRDFKTRVGVIKANLATL